MRLLACPSDTLLGMFQSSSDMEAGCDGTIRGGTSTATRFNPHPARRPDATNLIPALQRLWEFQSSSGMEARCDYRRLCLWRHPFRVSILIQHGGRMRQRDRVRGASGGAVSILIRHGRRMRQSRCNNRTRQHAVSIRIRQRRRMLHCSYLITASRQPFQSSSDREADATKSPVMSQLPGMFLSSCNVTNRRNTGNNTWNFYFPLFQSASALQGRCDVRDVVVLDELIVVSIRIRSSCQMRHWALAAIAVIGAVSILLWQDDRMQRTWTWLYG